MSSLRFRNLDLDPSAPIETWPDEAVQTALERGSLSDYRRLAAAVRADPWGPVARRIERVLGYSAPYGSAALSRRTVAAAREQATADANAEVVRRLRAALTASGLTQAAFAARLGTSASRLSTYLRGEVVPSAALLVRAETLANREEGGGQGGS